MITAADISLVGKVNKTHGINGELSVSFFDMDVMESVDSGACLLMDIDGIYVPFFVDKVRPRSAETLLITLDGEEDKESVSSMVGKSVFMLKSAIPESTDEEGGLYAAQLIGYDAVTTDGTPIGRVDDIDDNQDNPLFVITPPDKSTKIYVPIVDDFIIDIDMDQRRIELSLPDGLLEINE